MSGIRDSFDELPTLRNRMDRLVSGMNEGDAGLIQTRMDADDGRRFLRTFTLPTNVQIDNIKASYHDGLLEVTIPKKEEAKPRKIEVKTTKIIPERKVA